jgi:DNA repair exonuclease SbcCD ATPase subunit
MSENKQHNYTAEDKLRWEIEKLQAETHNLKRPYLKTASSWITILTVILALFGVTIQYFKSDRDYELAEIKRQQTELETKHIEADKKNLLENISQAKDSLAQLQAQREQVSSTFRGLQAKAKELESKATTLAVKGESSEVKQLVQDVNSSIEQLASLNNQAASQSEQTAQNLQALSTDVASRQAQTAAFAVIASYVKLEDALAHAKQLQAKGVNYPIEVYKRTPYRYAVTLGGYLTPEEAGKRVEYAKQQDIAQDAYVRFAQDWGENLFK